MKKVTCNQYYTVTVPVSHFGNHEIFNYDLGIFADKKDAEIAGQLFSRAIQFTGVLNMPKKVYKPIVGTMLVPENEYVPAYLDISNFMLSNKLVYNFVRFNEAYAKSIMKNNGGYDSRYDQVES